ncbi:MAG: hypothetical protein LBB43_06820 [Spirochaetaceae bacterium]|jgi:hypothetical protein|nr:hypothetical protein [Spirochaetaceae bacterium]
MTRIEIIANHSVEDNILDAFRERGVGKYYTKYPTVHGVGSSNPRMGDAVWPEENFALVIWCEKAEADTIEQAVASVKKDFPDEGIKVFRLAENLPLPVSEPTSRGISLALPEPKHTTPPMINTATSTTMYSGPEKENL